MSVDPLLPVAPTDAEKYLYLGSQQRWLFPVQSVAFLGVAYSLGRFALKVHGAQLFLLVLGLQGMGLVISLYTTTSHRRIDRHGHMQLIENWKPEEIPSVDVFLPTAGEPCAVLENTYRHVAGLTWKGQVKVLVLDDGDRSEVRDLAASYGFDYHVRPNRGEFKKAGNLKFGFENSAGSLIVIFDADFAPRHDFLLELVPYFDDPTLGIVQSPQYFQVNADQNWLQRTAGSTQEIFYRWIQPARDAVDAAICVGTNAVYRRAGLEAAGGFAQIEHSEDVYTGVQLMSVGFRTRYVPVVLATGLCPDDYRGFVNQQYRWCTGSMSLLRGWSEVGGQLSWKQRLCFWTGFLFYIGTAVTVFASVLPTLIMLWFTPEQVRPSNYLPLFGELLIWFVLMPRVSSSGWRLEVMRVQMVYSFAHVVAIVDMLRDVTSSWIATGSVRTVTPMVEKVRRTTLVWLGLTETFLWVGVIRGTLTYGLARYWLCFLFVFCNAYVVLPVIRLAWGAGAERTWKLRIPFAARVQRV